ncbi:protein of unknown function DUF4378 [Macleaya cordata]|uniref:DUF4378 domain-containing protein n=1 Tax=Macleaya cordata TaxID=56857 RepID=A0A200QG58_MACCD|nr:protein of unknown function DUF4378 [Macleaya cordata]
MASSSSLPKTTQVKRLSELLQEQQEPFHLDVYLLERGYSKKKLNFDGTVGCCPPENPPSGKDLKRLASYSSKRRKGNQNYPNILRSVLNKLTSVYDNRKSSRNFNSRTNDHGKYHVSKMSSSTNGRNYQVAELDRFSSASSMTLFDSCSESDGEEFSHQTFQENPISSSPADTYKPNLELHNLLEQEGTTGRTNQWGCMEDSSKQHSPVSVLEELPFDEIVQSSSRTSYKKKIKSTNSSLILPKKITDDESIFSASLWELLVHALIEKQGFCGGITEVVQQEELILGSTANSSQFFKTKRVLEQTKQLLFDCVREAVENNHERNSGKRIRMRRNVHEMLGGEDVGKIICEQICLWGKQSGNITNITQIISSDFCVSTEEWMSETQPQIRENIGVEIGDAILEEIKNEIVTDMIEYFELKT